MSWQQTRGEARDNPRTRPGPDRPETTVSAQAWADLAAGLAEDLSVVVARSLVPQGDLVVQQWPPGRAPAAREAAAAAAVPVPSGTVIDLVDGRHTLTADGPGVAWSGQASVSGLTLGTLVIEPGSTVVLGHDEHPERRIVAEPRAEVWVVRRQHRARVRPRPARRQSTASAPSWTQVDD